jgi:hypothetical protein
MTLSPSFHCLEGAPKAPYRANRVILYHYLSQATNHAVMRVGSHRVRGLIDDEKPMTVLHTARFPIIECCPAGMRFCAESAHYYALIIDAL